MQILYNQRGSAAVIGIMAMLFMTIVIGGLLPMVSTEVRSTRTNQDVVEAQYVAEAGAKRALVGFSQSRTDWAWANGTTRNNFQDGTSKAYSVTITPAVVDGAVPASGHYTITSTGFVGDVRKTVSIGIQMTAGGGGNANASGDVFSKYVIYDKGKFEMDGGNNPKITGDMGLAGSVVSINNNVNQFFNGKVYATQVPSGYRGWQNDWLVTNGLFVKVDTAEKVGTLTINMPDMPTMPDMPIIPTSVPSGASVFSDPGIIKGSEYYSPALSEFGGDLETTASRTTIYATKGMKLTKKGPYNYGSITSDGDLTLYVNGNMTLSNGSYIKAAGNIKIYVSGTFNITNAGSIRSENGNIEITSLNSIVDLNNASSIHAPGNITISVDRLSLSGVSYISSNDSNIIIKTKNGVSLSGNNNYIQTSNSGNVEIYSSQGSVEFNNDGCFVNGGKVVLQAYNAIKLTNAGSINNDSNYSSAIAYLYSANSTTSNSFVIGGKASLFLTTNAFNITNTFTAPKTVFVSSSGQTSISNSPKIAGIYTNGSLTIANSPTFTYDKDVMAALGLAGGSGGKAKVDLDKWSKGN